MNALGAEALNLADAKKTPRTPTLDHLSVFLLMALSANRLAAAFRPSLQNANG